MSIKEYIESRKLVHKSLLQFIESNSDIEESMRNFYNIVSIQENLNDINELKLFISLITKICNNHSHSNNFYYKILKILETLKFSIKQNFSNNEIFDLFKSNKRLLLYIINSEVLFVNNQISNILSNGKYKKAYYHEYLCLSKEKSTEFLLKQDVGENDLHMCYLIRKDMIDEFIQHINQMKIPLDAIIKTSIFETNSLLLRREPTLLEYCVFFGAVKIFKYLCRKKVALSQSLWIYAIHGNNEEIISILIKKNIQPKNLDYESYFEESIKCHHNSITDYFINNLIDKSDMEYNQNNKFNRNISYYCFRYRNYYYFPTNYDHEFVFFYACQFNYYSIVNFYLKSNGINIKAKII